MSDINDKKDLSLGIAYEIRKRNKAIQKPASVETKENQTPIEQPIKITGSIAESILAKKAKPIDNLEEPLLDLEENNSFADEIDNEQQDMISKLRARIKKQKLLGQ
jgi:hypothetical protein